MKSSALGENISQPEVLNISQHGFWIYVNQEELFLPFVNFPWFKEANISAILNVQLFNNHHLYWPDLDIDLKLESIKSPESYPLIYKQ